MKKALEDLTWRMRASFLLALVLLAVPVYAGAPTYEVLYLDSPSGDFIEPLAMNDSGHVVGYYRFDVRGLDAAFYFDGSTVSRLRAQETLRTVRVVATGINNSETIVGYVFNSGEHGGGGYGGVIWRNRVPDQFIGRAQPLAINDLEQVVGSITPPLGNEHAFLWFQGAVTDLNPSDSNYSAAEFVLDSGEIVGWSTPFDFHPRATLWAQDKHMLLELPKGATSGEAHAMNHMDQIVGTVPWGFTGRATLWQNGAPIFLDSLGAEASDARAINDRGQVVGNTRDGSHYVAMLWQEGIAYDLNTLVPESEWHLRTANCINAEGIIAAAAGNASGQFALALLIPNPDSLRRR